MPERRYPENRPQAAGAANGELAFLRLRYKLPGEDRSRLIEQAVSARLARHAGAPAGDMAFAAAVAAYGQLLRGDSNLKGFTFTDVRNLAGQAARGNRLREEFLSLAALAERQLPDSGRSGGGLRR